MKNLLNKLSRSASDRRAELEHEAAERLKSVASQPPAEASTGAWGAPAPTAPEGHAERHEAPEASVPAPSGRRLTVQERVAARQLQGQTR
ncbi:MAG: hypothetical protein KY447_03425 [Actinobacteria bacterium]|nr:hypothetical protein [Actinomycetota bacterium]MBW3641945.1 hypothetical protein [Actinomycetota bacterium]